MHVRTKAIYNCVRQCKADFEDSAGDNCKKYVDKKYCKPNGDYGENWKNKWGPFSKYQKDGHDGFDCPGCGCRGRKINN